MTYVRPFAAEGVGEVADEALLAVQVVVQLALVALQARVVELADDAPRVVDQVHARLVVSELDLRRVDARLGVLRDLHLFD